MYFSGKSTDRKVYGYGYGYGYGSVTASPYSVEEVSGSRPGRVILKTLKIVPTASLFGAEHIKS
jgi:hypothetical protein